MAHAFSTLQPSQNVMTRFLEELRQLAQRRGLDELDYYQVRISALTRAMVMLETLNDPDAVDDEVAANVLDRLIGRKRAEVENRKRELEQRIKADSEQQIRAAETDYKTKLADQVERTEHLLHIIEELRGKESEHDAARKISKHISEKVISAISKSSIAIICVALIWLIIRSVFSLFVGDLRDHMVWAPEMIFDILPFIENVAIFALSALTFYGMSHSQALRNLEEVLQRKIERRLIRILTETWKEKE